MRENIGVSIPVLSLIVGSDGHGSLRAVDDALAQTCRDIEVLVVAAGGDESADGLPADARVRRVTCGETTHPRIAGLSEACGRYAMFLEPGDRLTRDYCRAMAVDAERRSIDIVFGALAYRRDGACVERSLADHVSCRDTLRGEEIFTAFLESGGVLPQWLSLRGKLFSTKVVRSVLPALRDRHDPDVFAYDIAILGLLYAKAESMAMAEICGRYIVSSSETPLYSAEATRGDARAKAGGMGEALRFIERHRPARKDDNPGFTELRYGIAALIADADGRSGASATALDAMGDEPGAGDGDFSADFVDGVALFRQETGEYRDVIENTLKPLLLDDSIRCVSFDLFDTMVQRPFYAPEDLFRVLDAFADPALGISTPFHKIRAAAEASARARGRNGMEDVTLDGIYAVMSDAYGIDGDVCAAIRDEERRLEIRLCRARNSAREVYQLAKYVGKRVVVASDMYLDEATVEKILTGAGYGDHDALFLSSALGKTKFSGSLFKHMLRELGLRPEEMLHIGDNPRSDRDIPGKLGIRTFLFPGAMEAMRRAGGGGLGAARRAAPPTMRKDIAEDSFGCRVGAALAACRYFDDPFRAFDTGSDFNADPFLLGYHALGTHLLGVAKWVEETSLARGYGTIHYCARDGYMPMLFHRRLREAGAMTAECDYVLGSRTMVLPGLVSDGADFPPFIHPGVTTPRGFLGLFAFCLRDVDVDAAARRGGVAMDRALADPRAGDAFLELFLTHLFDRDKLERSRKPLSRYYESLAGSGAAFFDVGYNGKTPAAISKLTGKKINVLYIHREDVEDARRMHGFTLDCFYPFIPAISGPLREHLLSESAPHCVGMVEKDGIPTPVFAAKDIPIAEKLVISAAQRGALRFLDDYLDSFGDAPFFLPIGGFEMSLPLEGFLHFPRLADVKPFYCSTFENSFDKGEKTANLYRHARETTLRFSPFPLGGNVRKGAGESDSPLSGEDETGTFGQYVRGRTNFHKFLIYLVLDRKLLVEMLRTKAAQSGIVAGFAMRAAAWTISLFPDG